MNGQVRVKIQTICPYKQVKAVGTLIKGTVDNGLEPKLVGMFMLHPYGCDCGCGKVFWHGIPTKKLDYGEIQKLKEISIG